MKKSLFSLLAIGLFLIPFAGFAQIIDNSLIIQEVAKTTNIQEWSKQHFSIDHQLKSLDINVDKAGNQHQRFQLHYNNIPLKGLHMTAHQIKDATRIVSPKFIPSNDKLNQSSPTYSEAEAKTLARTFVPAEKYGMMGYPEDAHKEKASLIYFPENLDWEKNNWILAYEVDIYTQQPHGVKRVTIDAQSGELLFIENRLCSYHGTANIEGTAVTKYHGTQSIETTLEGDEYILWDQTRGGGIRTVDVNNDLEDFLDDDNFWDNANAQQDEVAGDVHWGSARTFDMYNEKFNRFGIDGQGGEIRSRVHLDDANAFWNGSETIYGDGGGGFQNPFTYIDIITHEMTHGVTQFTSGLVYIRQPGGLNEAFSDIMGMSGENFALPGAVNWVVGEQLSTSGAVIRNMQDPKTRSMPSTMGGQFWDADLEVHSMSSLANLWYYLMVEGDSGTNDLSYDYDVTGLGWDDAEQIAYGTFTNYLNPNSGYKACAELSLIVATDLYGACSQQVASTLEAWRAVGVLPPAPTLELRTDKEKICNLNEPITFRINTSVQEITWDFGDGNSSTEVNPTHTYTTNGNYTFTATGTSCETGAFLIEGNYQIVADDQLDDCNDLILGSNTALTSNYCEGKFVDNGGVNNDYSNNQSSALLVDVPNSLGYEIEIISFNTRDEDILQIRVDNGGFFRSQGEFSGNISPRKLFFEGSRVDFLFYADGGGSEAGFEINWTCFDNIPVPSLAPSASAQSCANRYSFTANADFSNNISWDFGDGETGQGVTATHNYGASGTYTVVATATNSTGSQSETFDVEVAFDEAVINGPFEVLVNTPTEFTTEVAGSAILVSGAWRLDGELAGFGREYEFDIPDLGIHEITFIAQFSTLCSDKDSFQIEVVDELSATSNINDNQFNIFPNPTKKSFTVLHDEFFSGDWTILLKNKLGQLIHSYPANFDQGTKIEFNLPALIDDLYFLEIHNGKENYLQKLMIVN